MDFRVNPLSELDLIYNFHRTEPSPVYEHFPLFRAYAGGCDTIIELGVEHVVSTWAFLRGLNDSPGPDKRLICCDLKRADHFAEAERVAGEAGIVLEFRLGNDLKLDFPEADLIFIDTWHVYGHLKRELEKFKHLSRKWIILHDTATDEVGGESIRMGMDVEAQMAESGYTREEIEKGIWPAVVEFLEANQNWRLEARYTNCNGLTVLEKLY